MARIINYIDKEFAKLQQNTFAIIMGVYPILILVVQLISPMPTWRLSFHIFTVLVATISYVLSRQYKIFLEKYSVYALYLFLIITSINSWLLMLPSVDPSKDLLRVMMAPIVMFMVTHTIRHLWFFFFFIFLNFILSSIYFNSIYNNIIIAMKYSSIISIFFAFIFFYVKKRISLDKFTNKLIDDQASSLNELTIVNKKYNEMSKELKTIIENTPLQLATIDPKTYQYITINKNSFPDNILNYMMGKTDLDYCNFVKINADIGFHRIEKIKHCILHKKTVEFTEEIDFDGIIRFYSRSYTPIIDTNDISSVLMTGTDITNDMLYKQKLIRAIEIDYLTGCYSRKFTKDKIKTLLNNERNFTIASIDIDNFKLVNDLYGHDTGDQFLKDFTNFIKDNIKKDDLIGRVGGDEFIIVLNNLIDKDIVSRLFDRIINNFNTILKKKVEYTPASLSIGIVIVPIDTNNYKDIFKYSDIAMYSIKRVLKNGYKFYDET